VVFGTLFEVYAARFLMEHFWSLILVIFVFAFTINETMAWTERKFKYFASSR
jgi:NitT/TauT family transport system permease protein